MTQPPPPGSAGYDIVALGNVPLWKLSAAGNVQLFTGTGRLTDLSIVNEAATAAAKVYVRDGTDVTGPVVAVLAAAAGSGAAHSPGFPGILIRNGVYVQVAAGTVSIAGSLIPHITPPE